MVKFASIVLAIYLVYYIGAIGLQLVKAGPNKRANKKGEHYSFEESTTNSSNITQQEEPTIVGDNIRLSADAESALKKK